MNPLFKTTLSERERGFKFPSPVLFFALFIAIAFSGCPINLDRLDPDRLDAKKDDDEGLDADDSDDDDADEKDGGGKDEDAGDSNACQPRSFTPPLLSPEKNLANLVSIEGVLEIGEVRAATLGKDSGAWLVYLEKGGYEFKVASKSEGLYYQAAIYGPRDAQGRYGEAAVARSNAECKPELTLEAFALNAGVYLIFIKEANQKAPSDYFVAVYCKETNCPVPSCEISACGLVCEKGFASDEAGCPLCACHVTACRTNEDCAKGWYCAEGKCREGDDCGGAYKPVCGKDGRTYANECEASNKGVEILHEGACKTECVSNADCPPLALCSEGYCEYEGGKDCDCPREWEPVCTQEKGTMPNECLAKCFKLTVLYEGECEASPGDDDDCDCPTIFDPVCGKDNVTYGNACMARCLNVEIAYKGECKDILCGGALDIPCPVGMTCEYNTASSKEGVCKPSKKP